ncbi:uncharacterized protein LOC105233340 isoform X3 [Bactrocera dorsalis]|uniref:Uncharacterized protein LOC105233340 isoform X3 n=1 Tax=Bactrocera dorsalis TaxID=27457 RepID=A0A6I9VML4_BACDO|nr:uncharacterized protein LOC105233340 isoform X3 [Bactrocera dorsalis]
MLVVIIPSFQDKFVYLFCIKYSSSNQKGRLSIYIKMDQFSHDLTVALMEETSLLDRVRVSRWGQRRRTRSAGSLPCAPQPTEKEDSSSSPCDVRKTTNIDGLDIKNIKLPNMSDSDDKETRLPTKSSLKAALRLGTLESDSLNETFSPSRFFKPNARRKRKFKRMSMECDIANGCVSMRKRVLKPDPNNRSNIFFCGKRKRSNRDRYQDYDNTKSHSTSMPRYTNIEDNKIRPRSYSSTSKPNCDRLLPLNKGLLSRIEKISQLQKTECVQKSAPSFLNNTETNTMALQIQAQQQELKNLRKKRSQYRRSQLQELQFAVEQHPMDCSNINDFLSSSSLSSSDSDDVQSANDTDREGDDELTDWPGNECVSGPADNKNDAKRKLTKKNTNSLIKSEESCFTAVMGEDDTIMLGSEDWSPNISNDNMELRYRPSEPIAITNKGFDLGRSICDEGIIPFKQIESEMSGETSNPFLSSPPSHLNEIREIRAGCRRIKDERPGFSIKTSVNERLARFLQDPRQTQIRLPDIEIYEHESLLNLATLYSLQISLANGCAILNKTSNTTQSTIIDQNGLKNCLLSDFKRRCYGSKNDSVPRE